jgi:hypothetical protein
MFPYPALKALQTFSEMKTTGFVFHSKVCEQILMNFPVEELLQKLKSKIIVAVT